MKSKRLFDLCLVIPALVVLAPFMLLIAIAIKIDSKGPVLFRQERVGLNACRFKILKFRTMRPNSDIDGPRITAAGDPRITRIGQWLRRWKLDEWPQLINVLTGTMSLLGPRPEMEEYINRYPEDVRRKVLSVRPGITDKATLEFRNEETLLAGVSDPEQFYVEQILPRKLALHEDYVDNWSLLGDVRLLLATAVALVR